MKLSPNKSTPAAPSKMEQANGPLYPLERVLRVGIGKTKPKKQKDGSITPSQDYAALFVVHPSVRAFGRAAGTATLNKSIARLILTFAETDGDTDPEKAVAFFDHLREQLAKLPDSEVSTSEITWID